MSKIQKTHSKATLDKKLEGTAGAPAVYIAPIKPQQNRQIKDLRIPLYGTIGGSEISSVGFRVPLLTELGRRYVSNGRPPRSSTK